MEAGADGLCYEGGYLHVLLLLRERGDPACLPGAVSPEATTGAHEALMINGV